MEKKIAIVGNGPLSKENRKEINKYSIVLRFNDTKNLLMGEKTTTLALRVNSTGISCVDATGYLLTKVDTVLLQQVYIVGAENELIAKIIKHYPKLEIIHVPNIFTKEACSMSTGTRMIVYFLERQFKIRIFGMNWEGKSKWHDFAFEKDMVGRLDKERKVKIYKTPTNNYLPFDKKQ